MNAITFAKDFIQKYIDDNYEYKLKQIGKLVNGSMHDTHFPDDSFDMTVETFEKLVKQYFEIVKKEDTRPLLPIFFTKKIRRRKI